MPRPPKVLAIGLNYRDHAEESGQPIPQRPVVFAKMPTCITGPGQPIYVPRVSRAVDWEAELCFVVGKAARYVKAAEAAEYIAGYCIGNDVSVRDWQFHSPTWMMGKSFDTHGPIGPWLVTPDEVDVGNLDVRLWVNGRAQAGVEHKSANLRRRRDHRVLERRFHARARRRCFHGYTGWRRRGAETAGVPEVWRHGAGGDYGSGSARKPGRRGAGRAELINNLARLQVGDLLA